MSNDIQQLIDQCTTQLNNITSQYNENVQQLFNDYLYLARNSLFRVSWDWYCNTWSSIWNNLTNMENDFPQCQPATIRIQIQNNDRLVNKFAVNILNMYQFELQYLVQEIQPFKAEIVESQKLVDFQHELNSNTTNLDDLYQRVWMHVLANRFILDIEKEFKAFSNTLEQSKYTLRDKFQLMYSNLSENANERYNEVVQCSSTYICDDYKQKDKKYAVIHL
jgi:hypothetical protein